MFKEIREEISKNIGSKIGVDISKFIFVPEFERGELSIKLFPLAKILKKDLKEVGEEVKGIVEKIEKVKEVELVGGYLNIKLRDEEIIKEMENILKIENERGNITVEFPSVNPNKPWHVGHLRNALLGESISRLLEYRGYDVERLNYINDLGLQVAESFYYFKNHKEDCKEKFDHCVGKQYVKAHKVVEESKEIEKKVRELLKVIERGDGEARKFVERVVEAQYETAKRYGVCSDMAVFESDLASLFEKGLGMLREGKEVYLAKEGKNKGCLVIKTKEKGNLSDEKVLVRSDGTLTYTGKDIIFHLWKLGKIKGVKLREWIDVCGKKILKSAKEGEEIERKRDLLINVIGIEQTYPQQIVKSVLEKFGEENKLVHLAYAFVRLKESHFSGRKGIWIGYSADKLIEEGKKRMAEKHKESSKNEKIVLSAIKFAILRVSPKKEVIFDWDRVLSSEGDSGVYLLYSYVRANSIIRKSEKKEKLPSMVREERNLVNHLLLFKDVVENSIKKYDPSILANYLLELSKNFHKFYGKVRVIGNEREEELLYTIKKYKEVMEKGMELLGIEVIEEM